MKSTSDYYSDIRKIVSAYSLEDIISLMDMVGTPPEGVLGEAVRRLRLLKDLLSDAPKMPEGAERFDGKFYGRIFKNKNRQEVRPDEFMVFLAKDNAFPATLKFYREECERQGAETEQLQAVDAAIDHMEKWRAANPDRTKVPDVEPGEIRTT